jgi:glycosyltransferase involved in cell wall biosynthesis
VGRGLSNVIPRLVDSEFDVVVLSDAALPAVDLGVEEHRLPTPWPHRGFAWLQRSVPRWLPGRADLFHCHFYGLPYRQPVPMVVGIHDLAFEHHPRWFPREQTFMFSRQARYAARTAKVVITVSESSKQEIVERYRVPEDRILIAPQGVDPVFQPGLDPAAVLDRFGVTGPYVVAMGGAPRRNLQLACEAWRAVEDAGPLLVVGKQPPPDWPGIVALGPLEDAEWAAVLSGASAFLYPTEFEGFGMPALEAAGAGTPVVCARRGSLPEVLGEAAAWAEDLTVEGLAAALSLVVRDPVQRAEISARALARARSAPGWEQATAVFLEAYRRALD